MSLNLSQSSETWAWWKWLGGKKGLPWWKVKLGKLLKSLGSVNSSWPLDFLTPSLHAEEVFLYSASVVCPCFHPMYSFFVSIHKFYFYQVCLPTHLLTPLIAGADCSRAWRKSLTNCQLFWGPLSFRANSHRISLHLNNPKSFSWRGCSLPFIFVTPLRTLNATISWLLQWTWHVPKRSSLGHEYQIQLGVQLN